MSIIDKESTIKLTGNTAKQFKYKADNPDIDVINKRNAFIDSINDSIVINKTHKLTRIIILKNIE